MSDFHKMANSTVRNAIPEGFFPAGKSKQVYDVLYSLTRGAIQPKRRIQISKTKLMKLAGVGSKVTIDAIVLRFCQNGLLAVVNELSGNHSGNEYEVFTWEEAISRSSPPSTGTSTPSLPSQTSGAQNLGRLAPPESSLPSSGAQSVNTGTGAASNTLLKTFLNPDDERKVVDALEKLSEAARGATGRELTRGDWAAFEQLVDLFIAETEAARGRTSQISAYMKFGVENMRRRLAGKPARERSAERVAEAGRGPDPEPIGEEEARKIAEQYREILEREAAAGQVPDEDRAAWSDFNAAVERLVGPHIAENWFSKLILSGIDREGREVSAWTDPVTADWVPDNYGEQTAAALTEAGLDGYSLKLTAEQGPLYAEDLRIRYSDEEWERVEKFLQ